MLLRGKTIDQLTEADLQALIDDEIPESKTLDFKEALPSRSKDDKRKFLADIVAFANTQGGYIVYGMKETEGIATELVGVSVQDVDATILRLENAIRDNIRPRLYGVEIRAIPLLNKEGERHYAFVVYIPQSYASPHMVGKDSRDFYVRVSAGNSPMDVEGIRQAFLLSETLSERIRNFRLDRIGKIISGETPVPLAKGAKLVLHFVPLQSFRTRFSVDLLGVSQLLSNVAWRYEYEWLGREEGFSFDGWCRCLTVEGEGAHTYTQVFRNGIVEFTLHAPTRKGPKWIPAGKQPDSNLMNTEWVGTGDLERMTIRFARVMLALQQRLGISPPVYVFCTLVSVKDLLLLVNEKHLYYKFEQGRHVIARNVLALPEVVIDNYPDLEQRSSWTDLAAKFKFTFDVLWNAGGWARSLAYNEDGNLQIDMEWR